MAFDQEANDIACLISKPENQEVNSAEKDEIPSLWWCNQISQLSKELKDAQQKFSVKIMSPQKWMQQRGKRNYDSNHIKE